MKKILIIQDSPALVVILKMWLQKEGFCVDSFETGEECIKETKNKKYDMILLDYHLPGMNGDEVCMLLKKNDKTKNIPILFMSASDESKLKLLVSDVGADGYIKMPFKNKSIINRIKSLLSD